MAGVVIGSVLVVNAGSTGLKLHLVDEHDDERPLERIDQAAGEPLLAVAHRVVHGGSEFTRPVVIDDGVARRIRDLVAVAPLHNARALEEIDAAQQAFPHAPHVAVFDTAFHTTMPAHASSYAVPAEWRERYGVRRYGFHGLSVEWSTTRTSQLLGRRDAEGLALVVCHLGGGCSVSAVRDGASADTTMGFSPLEGVPMATRSGSVDPGALFHLLRRGIDAAEMEQTLNQRSGVVGLAGLPGMREVAAAAEAGHEPARLAMGVFGHRVAGAVAAMVVAAGGFDALVFTAGIGENSAPVRRDVCRRLAPLGVVLDDARNVTAKPDADIAAASSAVPVLVVRAREELVAARAARAVLADVQR